MQLKDMLNSDMGDVIDWIEKNQHDFVIVPRELTRKARQAYHDSIERHEDCQGIKGCPDDQWDVLLDELTNPKGEE